ncbi:MAG: hypothetical protein GY866_22215 [Proteobacteria bacterium]|nr:hypothetical protein [Pseudomonadota bacterium]
MYLLKLLANQMLGAKWMYYRRIKRGDQGLKIFKEKSLMEQMKATRSALRFTTKNTKKLYRLAYQECIKEIKANSGLKEGFPELPEIEEGKEIPSLTSSFDAVIVSWTPIKFLIPAQQIRSKGVATQRHSEGLVAKLYFKVAAYYADSENWDSGRLAFYLRKINDESKYQDIVAALEPLKADLQRFSEAYEPFKFGKASLSKDVSQDVDAFDDAMSVESFDSQIRTLYWYEFIYRAIERFLHRYYLTLVMSTASIDAIRYLTTIFEPAFLKAVENKNIFLGSFETDRSKKAFRKPYGEYVEKMLNEPQKKMLKTKEGVFESYSYNIPFLEQSSIGFDIDGIPAEASEWSNFIRQYILAIDRPVVTIDETVASDEVAEAFNSQQEAITKVETRQQVLLQIMAAMITNTNQKRQARYEILERFKHRVKTDYELEVKRIEEIRIKAEKKINQMNRKLSKFKQLKQQDTVEVVAKDIQRFKANVETKIKAIREDTKEELNQQKARLNVLFQEVSKDKAINPGLTASFILELTKNTDTEGEFVGSLPEFIARSIQNKYIDELEPFYKNVFKVFELSPREKMMVIQSLERSDKIDAVTLSLDETEKNQLENAVTALRAKIEEETPGIFKCKVIFLTSVIPIDDLFKISIDHKNLHNLLCLKVTSPQNSQNTNLKAETIKALVDLNRVLNPVPRNNVAQKDKEKDKNYEKRINAALLNSLISRLN